MILIHKRECVLTLLSLLFALPVMAAPAHEYTVTVAADLSALEVTGRLAAPGLRIGARSSSALNYVESFETCDGERLRVRDRRLYLPATSHCIRYRVDLKAAARSERRNGSLDRQSVLVSPSVWLWRPSLSTGYDVNVTFETPPEVDVSAPWAVLDAEGQRFKVRKSPQSAHSAVAFGQFSEALRDIPGATLRIVVMKPRGRAPPDELIDWAAAAAGNVSLAYGTFPNPDPHVVVVPIGGSRYGGGSPVPFGRVVRDGGEAVELFVNENASLDRLYDDWTATHEFSHFMLPYVTYRHRWISEGFAQYFQNVLLARAGQYSEDRAWQKIYEGFERGRRSRPDLTPNDASRQRGRGSTMKMYWSGAVLALEADMELRRQSGGTQSLDTVLRDLNDCCLPSTRIWSGPELFEQLDALAGRSVFVPLYARYADTTGFPDYTKLFEQLGIDVQRNRIVLTADGELSQVRNAILSEPAGPREAGNRSPATASGGSRLLD